MEIAERIRRAVAEREFEVETAAEPIRATVSLGVAGFPKDGADANELIHQADLAVYRGKLQGRNRVVGASTEPILMAAERARSCARSSRTASTSTPLPAAEPVEQPEERRSATPKPRTLHGPTFFQLSARLALVVASVSVIGIGAGAAGLVWGHSTDYVGLLAVLALVGAGQALSFELAEVEGSLSVSVVGSLAGAALFDYRAALAARGDDRRRRLERAAQLAAHGRLQHRHDGPVVARGGRRLLDLGGRRQRGPARRRGASASRPAPSTSSSTWAC